MNRHDCLALLAACHGHLRYHGLGSLDAYCEATPDQVARLSSRFRGMIRDLVAAGDPDVLLALWPPQDVTWQVAGLTYDLTVRLLSANRGPHAGASTTLLSVTYDVRDAAGERQAWLALREALRGAESAPR